MNDVVWDTRQTALLLPPSEEVALRMELFAADRNQTDSYRHDLELAAQAIAEDVERLPLVTRQLFDRANQSLETTLRHDVSGYEPWSPGSWQPRMLARAVPTVPAMGHFIENGFADGKIAGGDPLLRDILRGSLLEEFNVVQESELVPTVAELAKFITSERLREFAEQHRSSTSNYPLWVTAAHLAGGPLAGVVAALFSVGHGLLKQRQRQAQIDVAARIRSFSAVDDMGHCSHHIALLPAGTVFDVRNAPTSLDEVRASCEILGSISSELLTAYRRSLFGDAFSKFKEYYKNSRKSGNNNSKYYYSFRIYDHNNIEFIIDNANIHSYLESDAASTREVRAFLEKIDFSGKSLDERLALADQFALQNPGKAVSPIIRQLFLNFTHDRSATPNEVGAGTLPPFPAEAPVRWRDRRQVVEASDEPGKELFGFVRAVYGPWLADGISKRALRKLDAALVNELNMWTRNGHEMPTDIQLLTVSQENARLLAAGPDALREHLGKFTGAEALREAARLKSAQRRV